MKWQEVTEEEITELYFIQQLSQREIGKILGIGQTSVRRIFAKYKIQSRTGQEAKNTPSCRARQKELSERYSKEYTLDRNNICQWCGQEFKVNNRTKKNQFCSKECLSQYRRSQRKKYFCKNCGKEIVFSNNKVYKRTYCDECIQKRPWQTKDRIIVKCGYCGKEIESIKSRASANKYCYCNIECMSKHYAEIYSGENSPAWRGGKGHHYIGNFYHQRNEARKRDNYSCQLCGITEDEFGQQMSVHHIKLYRYFDNKEEANNLDNLVCLCEKCHRFVHSNLNTDNLFLDINIEQS